VQGPPTSADRGGAISFTLGDVHPHDLATILDQHGVSVRAGHHCAKPLMRVLGLPATARASFSVYSNKEDVDALMTGLEAAAELFGL
jgi:cysteine desulfurase/selenocysteine lyase